MQEATEAAEAEAAAGSQKHAQKADRTMAAIDHLTAGSRHHIFKICVQRLSDR